MKVDRKEPRPESLVRLYLDTALEYQRAYADKPDADDPLLSLARRSNELEIERLRHELAAIETRPR